MAMQAPANAPLVCHGHSRPINHLEYSTVTEDGFFLISSSKGRPSYVTTDGVCLSTVPSWGPVPKTKQTASSLDPCSVCWQESQIPYLDCTRSNEVHHVLVGSWKKTLSRQIGV